MLHKMLTVTAFALVLAFSPAMADDEINFGVISTEASTNLKKAWEPFLEDMQKGIGLKVNAFYATDYAGVIEAMRFNKVQVGWFGNKSAMEAVDRASGEVFAKITTADGTEGYYSHIIVHKDSAFQTLDDILKCDKSLDFGIGDPNSTSGFLVPTTFIFAARDIDPKACFKTVRNANHEANALAVANNLVQAATNNSESLGRLQKSVPEARSKIRVIWTSGLIPSDPFVWRKDLGADTKKKLSDWLLSYGKSGNAEADARAKKVLAGLVWSGFRKSDDDQLLPIRQMEISKAMLKIKGDERLTGDEKKTKLAELEKQSAGIVSQIAAKAKQ